MVDLHLKIVDLETSTNQKIANKAIAESLRYIWRALSVISSTEGATTVKAENVKLD